MWHRHHTLRDSRPRRGNVAITFEGNRLTLVAKTRQEIKNRKLSCGKRGPTLPIPHQLQCLPTSLLFKDWTLLSPKDTCKIKPAKETIIDLKDRQIRDEIGPSWKRVRLHKGNYYNWPELVQRWCSRYRVGELEGGGIYLINFLLEQNKW